MALTGEVTVTLKNGAEYSRKIDVPKGDVRNPMTDEELSAKFQDCAHTFLAQTEIEKILGMLDGLETLGNISDLMNRLTYTMKSLE